ncbi:MepB family protein [Embleya sp. NPDC050493]|uniref:MepB family protein n=1 Tax=Embleya sp. NPDC050493 TaxID=3363989 RepID=UPI0037BA844D
MTTNPDHCDVAGSGSGSDSGCGCRSGSGSGSRPESACVPWPVSLPADLLAAKALVYDPNGFVCSTPVAEPESAEYGAHVFTVDGAEVRFRIAGTTPTKVGQFVTLWQRSAAGPIEPLAAEDRFDLVVISSRQGDHFGQFVFPKAVLRERGILSVRGDGGKRGFRVYPPWVSTTNRQADRTRAWQLDHFLTVTAEASPDPARCRALYHPYAAR